MAAIKYAIWDSCTMSKRCIITSFRKVDTLVTNLLVPVGMLMLFVFVFSGVMDVGEYNFVNFIIPGIIMQTIGQSAGVTAIVISEDVTKGLFSRFRSMPINKAAPMTGHVVAATFRNMFSTTLTIIIALLLGFRPEANFSQWLIIAGVLVMYILAITWFSTICGIIAKSAETGAAMTLLAAVLPYFSSGFVPVESMGPVLQVFARHQPMTPVIDTVRALSLGMPPGDSLFLALVWCTGIIVTSYIIVTYLYQRRLSA